MKSLKKLLYPPLWLMMVLTVFSAAGLILVFLKGWDTHPVAYGVYGVSFYTLSVLCIYCSTVLPARIKRIRQRVYDHELGNRYLTDAAFRMQFSLNLSLGVNLLYGAANALSAIWYRTVWFGIFAGYYIILAAMRFLLLKYLHQNQLGTNLLGEWKRARVCAAILTLVNLSLSAAILMMMYRDKGFEYHGILIYIMAMYTFYMTALSVKDLIKYRKWGSPVMMVAKGITLAAALVSMLSLETAMLNAFGADTSIETKRILIAATGAGISVIVLAMSSYMIIRSTKEIKKEFKNGSRE